MIAGGLAGCAPAISAGTEAGVGGALEALQEQENQARLSEITTSPEVQAAFTDIGESLTHGIVDALKEEVRGAGPRDVVAGVGDHTESIIREHVAPGVAEVVARSVEASLQSAASDENLAHARTIAAATTDAAVRSMTAAIAAGIREDIRPALTESDGALTPMVTRALSDEQLKQAVGAMAHEVSREVVLGSEGALDKLQSEQETGEDDSLFGRLTASLSQWWAALVAFVAALAVGLIALVVLLVKGNAQRRDLERDARHRESMMIELMNSVIGDPERLSPEQRARFEQVGVPPRGSEPAASPG